MENKRRNFIISGILLLVAIVFTILVKTVDVKAVGVNGTNIGFATSNQLVFETTGVNMMWYDITHYLEVVPVLTVMAFAIIGFVQLVKRKSILKVDKEIMLLGAFYVAVVALYVFFEKVIINYRPTLIDGLLEASYPSSHTLMAIFICGSGVLVNKKLFDNKLTKVINYILIIALTLTVVGRLISGVHWLTDIVGGIIISSCLLMLFYSLLDMIPKEEN